jgi:hypothetical protein
MDIDMNVDPIGTGGRQACLPEGHLADRAGNPGVDDGEHQLGDVQEGLFQRLRRR